MNLISYYFRQSVYSSRIELDSEMKRLHEAIQSAKLERRNVAVMEEGKKAELLLPVMQSLCKDEKYRSVQDLHDQIDKLSTQLEQFQDMDERIPVVKQILELEQLVVKEYGNATGHHVAPTNRPLDPMFRDENRKRPASMTAQKATGIGTGTGSHDAMNYEAEVSKIAKLEERVVKLNNTVEEQKVLIMKLKETIAELNEQIGI